ncbi:hypothetical protein [Falsiroseomonas sp. HW251]|uniref:hypothetical protein n=1 Tax=Falsiroseomonas sp. HW251 TaxID=3390998 RepID=UPI003D31A78F
MRAPGPLCPSAPPDWPDARLIGVAAGTAEAPAIGYTGPMPVTPDLLALAAPVEPTEVFRFAATCQERACHHFDGRRCGLVRKVVALLPEAASDLPRCGIRRDCRWWQEEGAAACRRCPQVVTDNPAVDAGLAAALRADA